MLFRYPGGKGKQANRILQTMKDSGGNNFFSNGYAEPFVGGGSVALKVAELEPNGSIYLNDSDPWIASFWKIVSGKDENKYQELRKMVPQPITLEKFNSRRKDFKPNDFLQRNNCDPVDAAYNALFFNRTTFSGILSGGPIGGDRQLSEWKVNCRWNASRLCKELDNVRGLLKGRTHVFCQDWREFVCPTVTSSHTFMYLDPPYYKAGNQLYPQVWEPKDHRELRDRLEEWYHLWLLSYDNHDDILKLYPCDKYIVKKFPHYRSMGNAKDAGRPKDESELLIYPKWINY